MPILRGLLLSVLLLSSCSTATAQRQSDVEPTSETKLVLANTALTGTFTLGRSLLEGHVEDWSDALRIFSVGAAGGYGFYKAKQVAGRHSPEAGLALGYLSASVVENTAQGRHPLSHLRLGIGGLDVRMPTPASAVEDEAAWSLEVNALWVGSFLALLPRSKAVLFEDGVLCHLLPDRNGQPVASAIGRFVILHEGFEHHASVMPHEVIHVIQSLQTSAVTPYYRLSQFLGAELRLGEAATWDVQIDWLHSAFVFLNLQVPYSHRWTEIEAYTLAPHASEWQSEVVTRPDH